MEFFVLLLQQVLRVGPRLLLGKPTTSIVGHGICISSSATDHTTYKSSWTTRVLFWATGQLLTRLPTQTAVPDTYILVQCGSKIYTSVQDTVMDRIE
jgi:hypothetical protein